MQFNPSSKKKAAAFTIIAKNYLPFARVLMGSVRDAAPQLRRIVILVDRPDGYFDPEKEDFEVILSEDLPIPLLRWFHFKYTILELSTAVKPYAAQEIFERYGIETLLYFDPDIRVYGSLDPILSTLERHSIVITPHLTAPLEDDQRPSDLDILRSGSYNLGFIGLQSCKETHRFIQWWQKKLYDHCVVDLAAGLFVDQRWIDLVPGLFEGVSILRDPGINVAYWNLAHRPIERAPEGYLAAGHPLCFFHFSGFDPDNPYTLSRHQDRFTLDELGDGRQLIVEYRAKLLEAGYAECKTWPYRYGFFANGLPIPEIGRPAHHEAPELVLSLGDPFSDEGYQAFLDLWNAPLAGPDGAPTGVTRLAYRIYRSRADVQAVMPDIFNGSLLRFMNWVVSSARFEHNLGDAFVAPIWEAILRREKDPGSSSSSDGGTGSDPAINEKIIQTLAQRGIWVNGNTPVQMDALNELIGNGEAKLHLSQLAKAIYESRPDLQRLFPDPCGQDGIRFISWFLTYGAREYRLAEVFLAPLRLQWETVLNSLNSPSKKMWYRLVYASMLSSAATRARLTSVIGRVRLTRTLAAMKLPAARERSIRKTAEAPKANVDVTAQPFGVNFIGYVRSEMGVGESVRCAVRAARSSAIPVSVKSVDGDGPYRRLDGSIGEEDRIWPYPVNVFHVNADQSPAVFQRVGPAFTQAHYNIGFWAWELEEFPDKWLPAFELFDEIWTPSTFCQNAIARKSPIPVVRMPHPILLAECSPMDRASFGIPSNDFVFLAIFDLLSITERKNPLGILKAFDSAFSASSCNCRLVLKINHAEHRPAEMNAIRAAAAGMPVTIIDRTLDRAHVNGLIQMSDCLVSLHRSEGFGFTMAEAMYLGKPVVATAYSGNVDFTMPDNAFLVGYDLIPVPPGCEPYDPGILWAEPKISEAASQMRLVATDPAVRCVRARKGQAYIQEHFSAEAVGRLMSDRLKTIQRILS